MAVQQVYRQATPLCAVCGAQALGSCGSCGRTFCGQHLVVDERRRCTDCELAFTQKEGKLRHAVGAIAGGAITAAVIGAVAIGAPALIALGGAVSAVAGSVGALVHVLSRRRFLRRRAQHGLLDGAQVPIGAKGGEFASIDRSSAARLDSEFGSYRSRGSYG